MWSALELRHVDLGDQRLNRRLVKLVDDLLHAPEASVPQAAGDWAATKAAYRFWDNPASTRTTSAPRTVTSHWNGSRTIKTSRS
jgi:hypothetical protein